MSQAFAVVMETDGSLSVIGAEHATDGTDAIDDVDGWTHAEQSPDRERP